MEDRRLLAGRAADAINLFALDVYQHLQHEQGNLFFSPLSIATGLAMAYAGAAGQTAAEMEQVLHLGSEPGIHTSFGDLMESIESHNEGLFQSWPDPPHVLTMANAIWPDNDFSVEQAFLNLVQSEYSGHVHNVDYSNPQQAENIINQWVSNQTKGKVPELVKDLDPSIRMVLTNAVYFNGYWESPFDPRHSYQRSFTLPDGQTIAVPTMYTELIDANYAHFDGFAALELPFEGGANNADYSMVFVLPPENGPADLSADLFAELDAWLEGPKQEQFVLISLPKIDTAVSTSLNQLLIGLGMPTAFMQGAADFSAMTPEEVFISKVFHKATLTINEQGTTAAAATEIDFAICFAAGTPVLTPRGARRIEELQPGDLVLARDENNVEGQLQPKRVEKVHHNESEILELLVQGRLIRTTNAHPFFVKGKGWMPAGELLPNDLLSTSAGDWAVINAVQRTQTTESVYNLRVADCHTYFVGEEDWEFAVWVHNSCSGEEPTFFADRPFHLFIRDNITSTIAFMGRIDDPRQLQNDVTPAVVNANADFDGNLMVDGADFLAWQRGLGMTGEADRSDGDSNADGNVDSTDLTQWMRTYGQSASLLEAADAPAEGRHAASLWAHETVSPLELVDAAMALEWLSPENEGEEPLIVDEQELMLAPTQTWAVDSEPIPMTAAAVAFEWLALDSIGEQLAVDVELDDEPLASLFE